LIFHFWATAIIRLLSLKTGLMLIAMAPIIKGTDKNIGWYQIEHSSGSRGGWAARIEKLK